MTQVDAAYAALIDAVLARGSAVVTRNESVRRLFAVPLTFRSTPLVAARKTAWRLALREWEWFLSGSDDVADLHPSVRHWWRPWADSDGRVRSNYSDQFRKSWGYHADCPEPFDQVEYLLAGVRDHPSSRRNVITTWNTAEMASPTTPITNCHGTVIQAFVEPADDSIHLVTYQRSADVICGLPHNWIQYWAFLLWLARRAGRQAGTLTWVGGDVHVYDRHAELARRVVTAADACGPTPALAYRPSSDDFRAADFDLDGDYRPVLMDRAEMVV